MKQKKVSAGRFISKCILLMNLFFVSYHSNAQYTLRIIVDSVPAAHQQDSFFVAGNFNSWRPGDMGFNLIKKNGHFVATIKDLSTDIYQFKFTRGSWQTVEATTSGGDVANRLIKLSSDTTVHFTVAAWKDDFTAPPRQHTASTHVSILDTAFTIPQLDRKRRIWIYLPEGYARSKQKYPVLYMHDGQNLFDDYTSGFGEWGVDECLDSLIAQGKPPCIVVGIDNGPKRMTEYNPYSFEQFGKGEGDAYVDFIANTLKPFIDKKYRTQPDKQNTLIAGSSMGGLISYYAMLKYPGVFGKAGIFSPAFWTAAPIKNFTDSVASDVTGKFFFYIGELEGGTYVEDMKQVMEKLGTNSGAMLYSVIDPDASHNEQAWRKWFAEFYTWIMADGFNNVIKGE